MPTPVRFAEITSLALPHFTATFAYETERMHTVAQELKKRCPSGHVGSSPTARTTADLRKDSVSASNHRFGIRPVGVLLTVLLTVTGVAAFAWYAPISWLQWTIPPAALLLAVVLVAWAYRLRDIDDGHGDDGPEIIAPWTPDPGGLEIDLAFWEMVVAETARLDAENARLAAELGL